jgi:hypothetical protein
MAIESVDQARMVRAARIQALVERKTAEEGLRVSSQRRGYDEERARGLSMMSGIVHNHEEAHLAALGGAAAGPITYDTVSGPGGVYASGGSIAVDLSPVPGDPEATLRKAERIRQAALAPSSPSSADLRAAAKAYELEAMARREMADKGSETDQGFLEYA